MSCSFGCAFDVGRQCRDMLGFRDVKQVTTTKFTIGRKQRVSDCSAVHDVYAVQYYQNQMQLSGLC